MHIITLFTSKSGQNIVDNPIWVIILLLCIVIGGVCNSKAFIKENIIFDKWCKSTIWFNRVFIFFGWNLYSTLERAKDLRIYGQNYIGDRTLNKLGDKDKKDGNYIFKMSIYPAIACTIIDISYAVSYLFVVLKSFFGAFGIGNIIQYVGALSRLGDGIQGLMFMLADNAIYCS